GGFIKLAHLVVVIQLHSGEYLRPIDNLLQVSCDRSDVQQSGAIYQQAPTICARNRPTVRRVTRQTHSSFYFHVPKADTVAKALAYQKKVPSIWANGVRQTVIDGGMSFAKGFPRCGLKESAAQVTPCYEYRGIGAEVPFINFTKGCHGFACLRLPDV